MTQPEQRRDDPRDGELDYDVLVVGSGLRRLGDARCG